MLPTEIFEIVIKYLCDFIFKEILKEQPLYLKQLQPKKKIDKLRLLNKHFKIITEKYFLFVFEKWFDIEIIQDNFDLLLKFTELYIDTYYFSNILQFFISKQKTHLNFWEIVVALLILTNMLLLIFLFKLNIFNMFFFILLTKLVILKCVIVKYIVYNLQF